MPRCYLIIDANGGNIYNASAIINLRLFELEL